MKKDESKTSTEVKVKKETTKVKVDVNSDNVGIVEAPKVEPKTLDIKNSADLTAKVNDVKIVGNPDMFVVLCKASSESQGWMKSTKAMQTKGGCLVQVTTQQRAPDGSYSVAEALNFIDYVKIVPDVNGGNKLVSR